MVESESFALSSSRPRSSIVTLFSSITLARDVLGLLLSSSSGEWPRIGSMPLVDAIGDVLSESFDVEAAGAASVCFEIEEEASGSLTVALDCSGVGCDVVAVGAGGGGKRAKIVEYCDMSENEASISNCMFRSN